MGLIGVKTHCSGALPFLIHHVNSSSSAKSGLVADKNKCTTQGAKSYTNLTSVGAIVLLAEGRFDKRGSQGIEDILDQESCHLVGSTYLSCYN